MKADNPTMEPLTEDELPSFQEPPLVEVVCGIQFSELERFLAPHFGLLWEEFKSEFGKCKDMPPLASILESYGKADNLDLRITDLPPLPRVWFMKSDESAIIQIQKDRFLYNWKQCRISSDYPRYKQVFSEFLNRLATFQNFVENHELGAIVPTQYELTYVNHICSGTGWTTLSDVGHLFPDFSWRNSDDRFLPIPTDLNWQTTFAFPDRSGRLRVGIRNGYRPEDNNAIIRVEMTARGIGHSKAIDELSTWFENAHAWIVKGFVDLTSSAAQKDLWRRTK